MFKYSPLLILSLSATLLMIGVGMRGRTAFRGGDWP